MSFETDSYGIRKECLLCGAPTQSRPAPNGYFCHSCVTANDEETLVGAGPVGAVPDAGRETTVRCMWCDETHKLSEADSSGCADTVRVGVGLPVFDRLRGLIFVSCPSCTKATEYPTTEEGARRVAGVVGTDVMTYDIQEGWI